MQCTVTILVWAACVPLTMSESFRGGHPALGFERWGTEVLSQSVDATEENRDPSPFKARTFSRQRLDVDGTVANGTTPFGIDCGQWRGGSDRPGGGTVRLSGGAGVRSFERRRKKTAEDRAVDRDRR